MKNFKVFVTRADFPIEAIDLLKQNGVEPILWSQPGAIPQAELLSYVQGVHGIFCNAIDVIDQDVMEAAATKRGIKVGHTPNLVTNATAELTVGLLLATSRRILEGYQEIINGNWVWSPTWLSGHGLKGSTVGIFGFGRIGQAVHERLVPFGVARCVYISNSEKTSIASADFVSFDTLLEVSDFIIVTAALTDDTKEIFNESAFSKMKSNAVFINTGRGGLVKQVALVTAIKTKQIWGAGLDVMTPEPLPANHELMKLKNCVLTPHIGTALYQTTLQMCLLNSKNIITGLHDVEMPAQVKVKI